MLSALLATALTVVPVESPNAVPLRLQGRTVALSAATLEVTCLSCTLVHPRLLGQKKAEPPKDDPYSAPPLVESEPNTPPSGELTPPPDVPSYQQPPPEQQQPPSPPRSGVKYDLNAGRIVGKEVAFGALALVLSDVAATAVIGAAILLSVGAAIGGGSSAAALLFVGIFVAVAAALIHLALSPLWVALAVKGAADEPTHNGLGGAALGAYIAAGGLLVLQFGVAFAIALVSSAAGGTTTGGALDAFGSLVGLVGLAVRWIGIPIAASWAMHRGPPPPMEVMAPHPRRPLLVSADGREVRPLSGATIFRF